MPRPIWKGHISFGLVNVPVVLYSAEQSTELHFNLIDGRNRARVRYERVNEQTGEPVPWKEIVKGYEYDADHFVLLGDEDFRKAAPESTRTVDIQEFIDAATIDPRYYDRPYYLEPDKRGAKGYVLLRETLGRAGKVGLARVVLHTREHLAALAPLRQALVLYLLRFQHELRDFSELQLPSADLAEHKITAKELTMAGRLVESMSGTWEPEKYQDQYRDALLRWIEQKAQRGDTTPTPAAGEAAEEPTGEIVNIVELLRKSLEGSGGRRKKAEPAAPAPARGRAASRKHA
jgi:DNA end-binding protein Ku